MRRRQEGKSCPRCARAELVSGLYPLEVTEEVRGSFSGYGCPNCGIVFFVEEAAREIKQILEKADATPLDPRELSLLLLYASKEPIRGAVSFMKEAFLLFKEKLKEFRVPALSPHFIPYYYGPYSFDIVESWLDLEELGLITREGRPSTNKETFRLTKRGWEEAKRLFDSLPEELKRELPEWRRGLDELGNDGILRDVYLKYPEYTDKSKIKKDVLPRGMQRRA